MKHIRTIKAVLSICGIVFIQMQVPCTFAGQDTQKELARKLSDEKYVDKVRKERQKKVQALIRIVKNEQESSTVRIGAARLLGGIRASEAVNVLIQYLDTLTPDKTLEKSLETVYPCYQALIQIGKHGSRGALGELYKVNNKARRMLLISVIKHVEGTKVAQFLIKEAISSCEDKKEKANLRAALKHPIFKEKKLDAKK